MKFGYWVIADVFVISLDAFPLADTLSSVPFVLFSMKPESPTIFWFTAIPLPALHHARRHKQFRYYSFRFPNSCHHQRNLGRLCSTISSAATPFASTCRTTPFLFTPLSRVLTKFRPLPSLAACSLSVKLMAIWRASVMLYRFIARCGPLNLRRLTPFHEVVCCIVTHFLEKSH